MIGIIKVHDVRFFQNVRWHIYGTFSLLAPTFFRKNPLQQGFCTAVLFLFVSNPVPQAHSKNLIFGQNQIFHHRAKLLICFSVDNICKNVNTHATLSQNIACLRYFSPLISLLPLKIRFLHFPPYHQTHHRHRTVPTDHELSF